MGCGVVALQPAADQFRSFGNRKPWGVSPTPGKSPTVALSSPVCCPGIFSPPEFKDRDFLIHKFDEIPKAADSGSGLKRELLDRLVSVDLGAESAPPLEITPRMMPVGNPGPNQDSALGFQAIGFDSDALATYKLNISFKQPA